MPNSSSKLLLDGVIVAYAPDARIAAEMPETLDASLTQHQRWELGRSQLIKRYVPQLCRKAARPLPGSKRRIYVDAALDQLLPPLSIVTATTLAQPCVERRRSRARTSSEHGGRHGACRQPVPQCSSRTSWRGSDPPGLRNRCGARWSALLD